MLKFRISHRNEERRLDNACAGQLFRLPVARGANIRESYPRSELALGRGVHVGGIEVNAHPVARESQMGVPGVDAQTTRRVCSGLALLGRIASILSTLVRIRPLDLLTTTFPRKLPGLSFLPRIGSREPAQQNRTTPM